MIKVLFVCLGNICRSPLAEGVFLHLLQQKDLLQNFSVDSAGTGDWHVGHGADKRSQAVAKQNGFELYSKARQVKISDFTEFDWIIAMDDNNREDLKRLCLPALQSKIILMRDFDIPEFKGEDVPDPYYGGDEGFIHVYLMLERSCANFLEHIKT